MKITKGINRSWRVKWGCRWCSLDSSRPVSELYHFNYKIDFSSWNCWYPTLPNDKSNANFSIIWILRYQHGKRDRTTGVESERNNRWLFFCHSLKLEFSHMQKDRSYSHPIQISPFKHPWNCRLCRCNMIRFIDEKHHLPKMCKWMFSEVFNQALHETESTQVTLGREYLNNILSQCPWSALRDKFRSNWFSPSSYILCHSFDLRYWTWCGFGDLSLWCFCC